MKKLNKVLIPIVLFLVLTVVACVGVAYAAATYASLPISILGKQAVIPSVSIPSSSKQVMNSWKYITYYVPEEKIEDYQEVIDSGALYLEMLEQNEFYDTFPIIDKDSLEDYLDINPEEIENGYAYLFIDEVDLLNTPTGIKDIYGHDILAVDAINRIVMVGIDVPSNTGVSKVKLALVYNQNQVDMSLVSNLSYWDPIRKHAENTGAILAINASSYNWHSSGTYATLYGAVKYHGDIYRKASDPDELIKFSETGVLSLGGDIESAYNAVEMMPILIKDGVDVYTDYSKDIRSAQSAIGQTADGVTLMLTASGGTYGSDLGIAESEILNIMKSYGAVNAACLSGGSRAIMYWNGRIVNETVDYDDEGVRLPDAFIVVPIKASETTEDTVVDAEGNTEVTADTNGETTGNEVAEDAGTTETGENAGTGEDVPAETPSDTSTDSQGATE